MSDEELKRLIQAAAEETRRHFDVVSERLETKIETVAEGLGGRIDQLDAGIERLRTEMANEFNDVRSMIRFSHHELDRRLRNLEEIVAELQSRVERLESSTH